VRSVIVIAPHPDDETLGCGGTLLRHKDEGDKIHWLLVTAISEQLGFSKERIESRTEEINVVSAAYGFNSVHCLNLPTTRLDHLAINEVIEGISSVFKKTLPNVVYLPYRGDVHTDHRVVCDAAAACTKWFRYPQVNRILAYETLSETGFGIDPDSGGFQPNVFVNIESHLEMKLRIFEAYEKEGGEFPFPRSEEAIRALAILRGASSGFKAAEAFMLLKETN